MKKAAHMAPAFENQTHESTPRPAPAPAPPNRGPWLDVADRRIDHAIVAFVAVAEAALMMRL